MQYGATRIARCCPYGRAPIMLRRPYALSGTDVGCAAARLDRNSCALDGWKAFRCDPLRPHIRSNFHSLRCYLPMRALCDPPY
eukprot:2713653-Rhodomonas_salina.2